MAKAPIFGAAEEDARQTRAKAKDDAEEAQVESALHKKNQKRASPPINVAQAPGWEARGAGSSDTNSPTPAPEHRCSPTPSLTTPRARFGLDASMRHLDFCALRGKPRQAVRPTSVPTQADRGETGADATAASMM